MPSCSILLMIGVPASGKTTLSHCLKNYNSSPFYNILHISFDELITDEAFLSVENSELKSDFKTWRTAILIVINDWISEYFSNTFEKKDLSYLELKPDLDVIDKIKNRFHHQISNTNCLNGTWVMLLDDNFYLHSMRHVYYTLAKHYRLGFGSVYCDIDVEEALSRNSVRHFPVENKTIIKMAQKFQKPDISNVWERFSLNLEFGLTDKEKTDKIICLINSISTHPFNSDEEAAIRENRLQSQIINSTNSIHLFDSFLRKSIRRIMLAKDQNWKQQNGKQLSQLKSKMCDQFRKNDLPFKIDIHNEEWSIQRIQENLERLLNIEIHS